MRSRKNNSGKNSRATEGVYLNLNADFHAVVKRVASKLGIPMTTLLTGFLEESKGAFDKLDRTVSKSYSDYRDVILPHKIGQILGSISISIQSQSWDQI